MIAKDKNIEFFKLLEDVDNFSHAYLFETNSIASVYPFVLKLAKKIICEHHRIDNDDCGECNICHLIDENAYDDYYLINPDTININKDELDKLFSAFSSLSINEGGHRVYVIYGIERMSEYVSNKILKFLEEPVGNIHALLLTENLNMVLPTIKSRCQLIRIKASNVDVLEDDEKNAIRFLEGIINNKTKMIAYINEYVLNNYDTRDKLMPFMVVLEKVILNEIDYRHSKKERRQFVKIADDKLLKMIKVTDKLSKLLNCNVNLNLLIDRYIIEMEEVVK